ncbi:hypothetical protein PsYK624_111080 [Phanerochaete sordida]|uniref:Uncharacterized protein n=1 Tax=Phanerochaete sordida TaxID=48140 RepID=A0A9P3LI92_9APHY|nr:hypothetical protein PsYK624_111080 [Phanerochaete sordida]
MSGTPPAAFPSPLGGVPLPADFAPCVLFAVLYATTSCVGLWRMARTRTRCVFVALTLLFTIERTVLFALRAHAIQAPPQDLRAYLALTAYWQGTLASGYGALFGRLLAALKALVLAALAPPPADVEAPSPTPSSPEMCEATSVSATGAAPLLLDHTYSGASTAPLLVNHVHAAGRADKGTAAPRDGRAQALTLFRRLFRICELLSLVPFVLGLLIGYQYVVAEFKAENIVTVQLMRFVIALVTLVLLLALLQLCYWEWRLTRTTAPLVVAALALVLTIIPIYHMCIMDRLTTSLTSKDPNSGNTPAEKAVFYIFQVFPELLVSSLLLGINARKIFTV